MAERDPYQVLGVSRGSSDAEIKKAFRKLARQFHPDRNDGSASAEARFKEVQAAYDSIGTAEARRKHEQEQMFGGFGGGGGNPFAGRGGFGGMGGMGGMEEVLSQMFGKSAGSPPPRSAPRPPQERGQNATVWLDLSRDEAVNGGSFNLTYTQLIPGSHGSIDRKKRTLSVNVKPDSKHGKEIRLKDQGHGHPRGVNGDLIVKIRIDPGEGCYWDDDRVVKEIEVPYSTLVLGGKVTVKLPSGVKGKITIPPLSQVGDRQRVKDIDLEFVLAEVEELSQSQEDAIQALRDAGL
ncbi:MAG: J domain-containing protein [Candidatus Poseidoniales archaeon]|nr:MAG: J domain-containing protein [Candidatus Poseidoniales archaeon]